MDTPTPLHGPDGGGRARPIDGLLAGYATGGLQPHLHALIESHLILSEENRGFVRALEAAIGAELDALGEPPPGRPARDQVLAAIYAGGWYGAPRPKKLDPDVPEPLSRLIGLRLADVPWKLKAPGLREHRVHEDDTFRASLFKIRPGQAMPVHTHDGTEVTLVLKGAFRDGNGRYARGDVAIADSSIDHRPVAEAREECVCFAVTDGPLRLTGPIGRLLDKVFRG